MSWRAIDVALRTPGARTHAPIDPSGEAEMKLGMVLLLAAAAGSASAQPALTSLGSGTPISVTNNLGGTYYIGGTAGSGGIGRWTLTGSTMTPSSIGGNAGGYMSSDGLFQVGTHPNTSPQVT